jgi:hypothetical protein
MSEHAAEQRRFYGKYRGKVTNTLDPMQRGRVQVSCPAVLGEGNLSWALPCSPYAGNQVGLFLVPPVDANVWVEFEGGDTRQPILAGCFWDTGEVPASPAVEQVKMLKTDAITLELSDVPGGGGLTIEVGSPAVLTPVKVTATSAGLEISMGAQKIVLSQTSVSINDGALEVM